jgi:hypothetical protein
VALRPVFDGDAGWHLAIGRLIAQSGIPRTNALSWTAPDHPWYATAWLFDLAAFELSRPFGARGIQLIVLLLLAATLVAWAIALRLVDPELGSWLVNPGALFNLEYLLDNLRVQSVISVVEFLPGSFDLVLLDHFPHIREGPRGGPVGSKG